MEQENSNQQFIQWQKRQLALALVVTCVLAVVLVSLAWLNYSRSLVTATKVWVPSFWLDDIHGVDMMDLGEIDVNAKENDALSRRYVFAVCSNNSEEYYYLQLAHTTNIGFDFNIYSATESTESSGTNVPVTTTDALTYYYQYDPSSPLTASGTTGTAHDETYVRETDNGGTTTSTIYPTEHVQTNAEPVYWQSEARSFGPQTPDGGPYVDYYVLVISWDESVQNTKETDMVYLMAQSGAQEAP